MASSPWMEEVQNFSVSFASSAPSNPPGGSMATTFTVGNFSRRKSATIDAVAPPSECPVSTNRQPRHSERTSAGIESPSAVPSSPRMTWSKMRCLFKSLKINSETSAMPLWQCNCDPVNFLLAISLPSKFISNSVGLYMASVTQSAMESVPRMDKTTERFFTSRAMKYGALPTPSFVEM